MTLVFCGVLSFSYVNFMNFCAIHCAQQKLLQGMGYGKSVRNILNGVSAYFNPMELIAILGPSGESVSFIVKHIESGNKF